MFTDNPYSVTDRMRMIIGDTDPDNPLISDAWYNYYLEASNNNETAAAMQIANRILALYSGYTREREGAVEIYGADKFNNYLDWLKTVLTDSTLAVTAAPMPYCGGTSISDIFSNEANPDNVRLRVRSTYDDAYGYATMEDPYKLRS